MKKCSNTHNNFIAKEKNINISKYTSNLFHIKNYIIRSFKVDERNYPYEFIKNTTILKTKLITWDMPLYPMIILNYMNSLSRKNVMAISRNYALVEMLIYYQKKKSINFDHYYYTKKI